MIETLVIHMDNRSCGEITGDWTLTELSCPGGNCSMLDFGNGHVVPVHRTGCGTGQKVLAPDDLSKNVGLL